MRLEPDMWEALKEICALEGISIHEFCGRVEEQREESAFTAAIRVAILAYYREKVRELASKCGAASPNQKTRDRNGETESDSTSGPQHDCAHGNAAKGLP